MVIFGSDTLKPFKTHASLGLLSSHQKTAPMACSGWKAPCAHPNPSKHTPRLPCSPPKPNTLSVTLYCEFWFVSSSGLTDTSQGLPVLAQNTNPACSTSPVFTHTSSALKKKKIFLLIEGADFCC